MQRAKKAVACEGHRCLPQSAICFFTKQAAAAQDKPLQAKTLAHGVWGSNCHWVVLSSMLSLNTILTQSQVRTALATCDHAWPPGVSLAFLGLARSPEMQDRKRRKWRLLRRTGAGLGLGSSWHDVLEITSRETWRSSQEHTLSPKGPCTQIGDTLAPKYPNRDYFKAKVYTIWVHGPLGIQQSLPRAPRTQQIRCGEKFASSSQSRPSL